MEFPISLQAVSFPVKMLFLWIALPPQKLFCEYLLSSKAKIGNVTGNHENFSGNKGKDDKQQKFSPLNKSNT